MSNLSSVKETIQKEKQTIHAQNSKKNIQENKMTIFNLDSKDSQKNLMEYKMSLPHIYLNTNCIVDNIFESLNQLNKIQDKISISDFVIKSCAHHISRNKDLKLVFDEKSKKIVPCKDVIISCNSFTGNSSNIIYYNFTNQVPLANIKTIKILAKDNLSLIPILRVFDYSELNVNSIDEIIVPPAMLSLTINKVSSNVAYSEDKVKISKSLRINLSAVASAFQENDLLKFLDDLKNTLENPFNISF